MPQAPALPPGVRFVDSRRAGQNYLRLSDRLGRESLENLALLLRQVPSPDEALAQLTRLVESDAGVGLARSSTPALHAALTLFAHSRFLSEAIIRNPDVLGWALEPDRLYKELSAAELRSDLGFLAAPGDDDEAARVLARFKRMHVLRVALRDLLGLADLAAVTVELSNLADALLDGAYSYTRNALTERFGRPLTPVDDGVIESSFVVLALGKLGGRELNYSSDIDLMYLHAGDGETAGPVKIPNRDFHAQLGRRLTAILSQTTLEGFAYRVDLRLRPEGAAGELAPTLDGAVAYYNDRARDWELQMLIKARPAAGDRRLGEAFLRMVRPLIYRTTTDFSTIEKLSATRDRIQQGLDRRKVRRVDVKLERGGIRDIEFLVQCFQRLYGGRDPFVRSGGTLFALHRLREKGYLSMPDYGRLSSAYQYLRIVEHRLQLVENRQTHELPADAEGLALLERRVFGNAYGGDSTGDLVRETQLHLKRTSEIYERVVQSQLPRSVETTAALGPERRREAEDQEVEHSFSSQLRHLERVRPRIAEAVEGLEIRRGARLLGHLLDKVVSMPAVLDELEASPALVECTADLMEQSPYLGEQLVRYPEDIAELAEIAESGCERVDDDPTAIRVEELSRRPEGRPLFDETISYNEKSMLLRSFYRKQMLRLLADSVHCGRPVFTTLARTSDLAEWVVRRAYDIALAETARLTGEEPPEAGLLVIALGRLGMREFDLGSDADLVFVLPDESAAGVAWQVEFVERLIEVISSYTNQGMIFSVDARLRPRGRDGDLVQTESAYRAYFAEHAEAWEAMSYMKARTVAGDLGRGKRFLRELQRIGWKRFGQDADLTSMLLEMRKKLEREQGDASPLKAGAGGYYDIDFILLYLRLRQAGLFFESLTTPERVDLVREMGELTPEQADFLGSAAVFSRGLDHAIRASTGSSSGAIPGGRALQDGISELLVRWGAIRPTSQPLDAQLETMRRETRALFQSVFSKERTPSRRSSWSSGSGPPDSSPR